MSESTTGPRSVPHAASCQTSPAWSRAEDGRTLQVYVDERRGCDCARLLLKSSRPADGISYIAVPANCTSNGILDDILRIQVILLETDLVS